MKIPILWLFLMTVPLATYSLPFATAGEPGGPNKKLKIVVFGGHPDDPESGAGGLDRHADPAGPRSDLRLRHDLPE